MCFLPRFGSWLWLWLEGWGVAGGGRRCGILPDAKEEVSANISSQMLSGQRDVKGRGNATLIPFAQDITGEQCYHYFRGPRDNHGFKAPLPTKALTERISLRSFLLKYTSGPDLYLLRHSKGHGWLSCLSLQQRS